MDPIIVEYKINVPVQRVWKALTDKDEMKKWYFDISDFDLKVGKIFNFYEPGEAKKYHHQAEILEIIPQHILKHSWMYPEFSTSKTIVTWELITEGNETLVRLTHEGVDQCKELGENFSNESFTTGWNEILGQSLKPYLEK